MKKFLVLASMCLLMSGAAIAATAQTVDVSKLSQAQRDAVTAIVDQKTVSNTLETVDSIVSRIEQVSAGAAKGLVSFAKELGVAANTFAETPLGILVTLGLVMYFAGPMITSLLVGFILLFILFPISAYFTYRLFNVRLMIDTYELRPVFFGLWQRRFVTASHYEEAFRRDGDTIRAAVMGVATFIFFLAGCVNFVL